MTSLSTTLHIRPNHWAADELEIWQHSSVGGPTGAQTVRMDALGSYLEQLTAPLDIVIWLPAYLVLEQHPTVPAKSASQLPAHVPFAVEESLTSDVEDEHFALGTPERQADGQWQVPVRVLRRARLQQLLAVFESSGVPAPRAIYAESDALPAKPGDIQVWLEGEVARLRHPDGRWQMVELDQLDATLSAWASSQVHQLGLWVLARAEDRPQYEPRLAPLGDRFVAIRWQATDPHPLAWLSGRDRSASLVNLLQGAFAPTPSRRLDWRAWRWPIIWTATAVLLLLAIDVTLSLRDHALVQNLQSTRDEWREVLGNRITDREAATALSRGLNAAITIQKYWPEASLSVIDAKAAQVELTFLDDGTGPPPELAQELIAEASLKLASPPLISREDTGWRVQLSEGGNP